MKKETKQVIWFATFISLFSISALMGGMWARTQEVGEWVWEPELVILAFILVVLSGALGGAVALLSSPESLFRDDE